MELSKDKRTLEKLGNSLEKRIFPFSRYLSFVAMVASMVMMLMVVADVFLRRVVNAPIFGSYEMEKFLLTVMVFCSVAFVMSEKGHVIVDTLTRLYPKAIRRAVYAVAYFLSMVIIGSIAWLSTGYGVAMLRAGETSSLLKIPLAPFILIVAFGSLVMFLVILVQFIYAVAGVDEKAPPVGFW